MGPRPRSKSEPPCSSHGFLRAVIAAAISLGLPALGMAYKLSPRATPGERQLAGITSDYWTDAQSAVARLSLSGFSEPVHEEITNRIFGCEGDSAFCTNANSHRAPAAVLAGVRWNDDPPFRVKSSSARGMRCKTGETIRFETQPGCWASLFLDAKEAARSGAIYGPGDAMLYRTHFGDLQFLHAMASRDGERALDTKAKIMGWLELSWRTGVGEYTLDTRLKDIPIPVIRAAFGRTEWRPLDLYTQGADGGLRSRLDDVAFGSFLHTVEDSFAGGHANREESSGTGLCQSGSISFVAPGAIHSFHSYVHQDSKLHGVADNRASFMRSFQFPGNVVQTGRSLVSARAMQMKWESVKPLVECIFDLRTPDAKSGPGGFVSGVQ